MNEPITWQDSALKIEYVFRQLLLISRQGKRLDMVRSAPQAVMSGLAITPSRFRRSLRHVVVVSSLTNMRSDGNFGHGACCVLLLMTPIPYLTRIHRRDLHTDGNRYHDGNSKP